MRLVGLGGYVIVDIVMEPRATTTTSITRTHADNSDEEERIAKALQEHENPRKNKTIQHETTQAEFHYRFLEEKTNVFLMRGLL